VAVIRKCIVAALLVIYLETTAHAKLKAMLLYNIINQIGQGGKQVYDGSGNQDITVNEPVLFVEDEINNHTKLNLNITLDSFSGASDAIFDSGTGASGTASAITASDDKDDDNDRAASGSPQRIWEQRQAFDLSIFRKMGTWVLIPTFGASTQEDYRSNHGGLSLQKSFAEDNFVLAAGFIHYDDYVNFFELSAVRFSGWLPRTTDSYDISVSQILSANDVALLGMGFARQTGHLSTDRNTENLNGARVAEALPGERNKKTSTLRIIHGIGERLALHFDYRYYEDDWQLIANTYEPSIAIGLGERQQGIIRLLYRYYAQNGVAYYRDSFTQGQAYMTSDSDLERFDSREIGLQGSCSFDVKKIFSELNFGGGIIYYNRSNNLSAIIYQLSLGGTF